MAYLNFETFLAEYASACEAADCGLTSFQVSVLGSHLTLLQHHLQHTLVMSVLENPTPDILAAAKVIANSLAVGTDFSQVEKYVG